jgi:hypothetical protein
MQDILSPHAAKPDKARASKLGASPARRDQLRVLLLGVNLWALCVLWPALFNVGHRERGIDVAFETLGLLPLALGTVLRRSDSGARADVLRPTLLLVVFPAALSAAIALRAEALNQQLFGPFALCLLATSLCAYGAAVASYLGRHARAELSAKRVPLGPDPWDAAPAERWLPRRAFIGACVAGAAGRAWVAPSLGGYADLEAAWGDAAPMGGVLTAVVGAALAASVLAIHLSEGLRAPTRHPEGDTGLRTAWFLFLALLGAVTYFVVQP